MKCNICPLHCNLIVEGKENSKSFVVRGNKCPQGKKYALREIKEPSRILFSRVLLDNGPMSRLHVKTDRVIPNSMKDKCVEIIEKTRVEAPVLKGDVLIENILGTGANVISARKIV